MRTIILLALVLAGCTKPNPNRCCVDEADCAAADLPLGMTCDEGLVCRGNNCIAEVCESNAACDVLAPYCTNPPDGVCTEACTADTQCPGQGETTSERFCEVGDCVECRSASDCSASTPTCSSGKCVACVEHADCASGVCTEGGTCAPANMIAYVDVLGALGSDCTSTSPCSTVERALAQLPARPYLLLSPGSYSRTGPVVVTDRRYFIGRGTPRPIIDRDDYGPIITPRGTADLHIERLDLTGATGLPADAGGPNDGYAIDCRAQAGSPNITLTDVLVTNNVRGVSGRQCKFDISRSRFANMGVAVELTDTIGRIDRSMFEATYVSLDGGLFTFTNNVVARSPGGVGVDFFSDQAGSIFEFNTFVNAGMGCSSDAGVVAFANNIFARTNNPTNPTCTFPGSIVAPTDISALKFKHADSAPYDYHLMPGSSAIDAAMGTSSLDHDIDGETRPRGAARDVGADEAQ